MPDESFPLPPRVKVWIEEKLGPPVGAVLIFALLRLVLEWAAEAHWVVGLMATLVLTVPLVLLLKSVRQKLYSQYSHMVAGSLILVTALMAIAVFSSASALLYHWRPQSYSGKPVLAMGTFADYYFWHAVDAIPGLRLWDSFGATAALQQSGFMAGLLLLIFRAVVLATLMAAFAEWFASQRKPAINKVAAG